MSIAKHAKTNPIDGAACPGLRARMAASALVGALCAILVFLTYLPSMGSFAEPIPSDLVPLWGSARLLAHGQDPYPFVGPGKPIQWDWPLLYPLTTIMALVPLAPLPLPAAQMVFGAVTGGLLTFAITRESWDRWPILLSSSFLFAIRRCQWSPLLFAGYLWAPLAWTVVLKPSLGIAVFAARPRRIAAILGGALLALSFILVPGWLSEWVAAVRTSDVIIPMLSATGAWVVAFALLRWRDADARLLFFTLCVAQTFLFYETLYAFAVARTRKEHLILALGSNVAMLFLFRIRAPGLHAMLKELAPALILCVYVPALLILWRRSRNSPAVTMAR